MRYGKRNPGVQVPLSRITGSSRLRPSVRAVTALVLAWMLGVAASPAYAAESVHPVSNSADPAANSGAGEGGFQPVDAAEEEVDQVDVERELSMLGFESLDQRDEALAQGARSTCALCYSRTYQVHRLGRTENVRRAFVRYLTPAWAKASNYTWSSTTTVTAGLSASVGASSKFVSSSLGFAYSPSQSWSISIQVPAKSSRFSKLALRSDFKRTPVRVRAVNRARFKPTLYGKWKGATHVAPGSSQYLAVVYK